MKALIRMFTKAVPAAKLTASRCNQGQVRIHQPPGVPVVLVLEPGPPVVDGEVGVLEAPEPVFGVWDGCTCLSRMKGSTRSKIY